MFLPPFSFLPLLFLPPPPPVLASSFFPLPLPSAGPLFPPPLAVFPHGWSGTCNTENINVAMNGGKPLLKRRPPFHLRSSRLVPNCYLLRAECPLTKACILVAPCLWRWYSDLCLCPLHTAWITAAARRLRSSMQYLRHERWARQNQTGSVSHFICLLISKWEHNKKNNLKDWLKNLYYLNQDGSLSHVQKLFPLQATSEPSLKEDDLVLHILVEHVLQLLSLQLL